MPQQLDTSLFLQSTGELDVLATIARVFLRQLGPWRVSMLQHSEHFDARELTNLVHKMKGSCQVIAAMRAAEEFETAEHSLAGMNTETWCPIHDKLKAVIFEIELELQAIVDSQVKDK